MDVNQISKIDIFSKRLLYKLLGGRPVTETTGIILCFLMANILELIKILNFESLLTNLLHRGPLKTTSRATGWAALP